MVKRLFAYLKGTINCGIFFNGPNNLIEYTDLDYGGDSETLHSKVAFFLYAVDQLHRYKMDPLYLSYSQANGVPQESKLATYMNHQSSSPTSSLNQSMVALTLDQPVSIKKENVGGTTYFYPTSSGETGPLAEEVPSTTPVPTVVMPNFTVYTGSPTHVSSLKEKSSTSGFYVSEELRMEQMHRNALILAQPDPEQYPDLPAEVEHYRDLCPLKPVAAAPANKTQLMGYSASSYKATNVKTGIRYCLQRIHGYRLPNTKCMAVVDMWKQLEHSNVVQLRDVFTTKAFGDYSIIFVYDYHPGAETLTMKHFQQCEPVNGYTDPFSADPNAPRPYSHQKNKILLQQQSNLLPESVIWNYIIQLTAGLRVIHAAGLACRTLDPNTIILSGRSHLRINSVAIPDVLTCDSTAANPHHLTSHCQQEDLTSLGKLVLALACRSLVACNRENIQTSLDLVARAYSPDLRNLIMYLLTNSQQPQQPKSVTDLMPMIGARFYTQLDAVQARADMLENELAKELENGRLCRLLVKLGTICLMSRDGQSILVVSYAELKHCLEQSFSEILSAATKQDIS
ncbi:PAN2-PAN3 deadenylation complex subunit PAN3 [Gryllus bimaculatus]|nr:PAN2-PAN3 deadenylation complex subunit PAN3 [Gryllus bimaculatus]